jgi:hypothetical protein
MTYVTSLTPSRGTALVDGQGAFGSRTNIVRSERR